TARPNTRGGMAMTKQHDFFSSQLVVLVFLWGVATPIAHGQVNNGQVDRESHPTREYRVQRQVIARIPLSPSPALVHHGAVEITKDRSAWPLILRDQKLLVANNYQLVTWIDRRGDGTFAMQQWAQPKERITIPITGARANSDLPHFSIHADKLLD